MTIEELIEKIKELKNQLPDPEHDHYTLEKYLLDYIDNEEVTKLFYSFELWYV